MGMICKFLLKYHFKHGSLWYASPIPHDNSYPIKVKA